MTTSHDTINTLLDDPANAIHVLLARSEPRRSMTTAEPWHWYQEWRLCVLTVAGRDALLPHYHLSSDQSALFGDRPTLLQERRVDVAPDGGANPPPWDAYSPCRTPWEAVSNNGTGVLRADKSLHPFHAFAVERHRVYSELTAERSQLVQQRDRARPPDLNTRAGQHADREALSARGIKALKDARLYSRFQRAQGDPAALAALESNLAPIRERVRQEHDAERAERVAEVARLSERIAEIDVDITWARSGQGAPPLLDTDPVLPSGETAPTISSREQLWQLLDSPEAARLVEPWKRALAPGALVILVKAHTAPVWYAELETPSANAERQFVERDAVIYSRDRPAGKPRVIRLTDIALALTPEQFEALRGAEWPDTTAGLWEVLADATQMVGA